MLSHALESRRDFVDAYNNLGNVLKDVGRLDQAIRTIVVRSSSIRTLPRHTTTWALCSRNAAGSMRRRPVFSCA